MRDPFALAVWIVGVGVMAYGFWTLVAEPAGGSPLWWEIAFVVGGFVVSCIGAYAVGRAHAEQNSMEP